MSKRLLGSVGVRDPLNATFVVAVDTAGPIGHCGLHSSFAPWERSVARVGNADALAADAIAGGPSAVLAKNRLEGELRLAGRLSQAGAFGGW